MLGGGPSCIPASYMPEEQARLRATEAARTAPSFDALSELARTWREGYGPLPEEAKRMLIGVCVVVCVGVSGLCASTCSS